MGRRSCRQSPSRSRRYSGSRSEHLPRRMSPSATPPQNRSAAPQSTSSPTTTPSTIAPTNNRGFVSDTIAMTAALTTSRVASELILDAIHGDTGIADPVEGMQPDVSGIPMTPGDSTTSMHSSGLCSFEFSEYTNCMERFPNDPSFCRNFLDIFKACQIKNQ